MVGALYGTIAPLSGLFVSSFFYVSYKVFKYMTLFIYGSQYEGGGFLFYTMSNILFFVLYMIILLMIFFFSVNGSSTVAGLFSVMLWMTLYVQLDVQKTFVAPSRTLSLAKARAFDDAQDTRPLKDRKFDEYQKARKAYEEVKRSEDRAIAQGKRAPTSPMSHRLRVLPRVDSCDELSADSRHDFQRTSGHGTRAGRRAGVGIVPAAIHEFNERYNGDEAFYDSEDDEDPHDASVNKLSHNADFFIYRQPSLNKATWEMTPKSYRTGLERDEAAELWGDVRPEQTRKVARQRRASIAMYYGK